MADTKQNCQTMEDTCETQEQEPTNVGEEGEVVEREGEGKSSQRDPGPIAVHWSQPTAEDGALDPAPTTDRQDAADCNSRQAAAEQTVILEVAQVKPEGQEGHSAKVKMISSYKMALFQRWGGTEGCEEKSV